MKIGIDGTTLTIPYPCGSRNYARGLIFALGKIDKKNEYYIFAPHKVIIPKRRNFHLIIYPRILPILKRQLWLPFAVGKEKINIFHYLDPFGSIFLRRLTIITTVNDINLDLIYPKYRSLLYFGQRYYCEIMRYFISRHTKHFITISAFAEKELKDYLKKTNQGNRNSTIIYDAQSREFRKTSTLKRNYFLCMGDYSPRKNIEAVFKAFSILPDEIKCKYHLYVVVSTYNEAARFKSVVDNLGMHTFVKFEINIGDKKLRKLYNQSRAFLYLSVYEGFGLPIVEAMACGCPVVTSNLGSMKEIAGGAAVLVNPWSIKEIRDSMVRIVRSELLQKKLSSLGLARAKQFSWEKTARETLSVYKKLYLQTEEK